MDYKLHNFSSGLRVLTVPMPKSESVTATIWVKTGSRKELREKLGISHYLEHMVFKGSKKYPNTKILSEIFDSMGAEHNAGTSKEWTNFWIKLANKDLPRGFEVLSDIVLNPLLDKDEMAKERNVILQEINMYEDTPITKIWDIFENLIYDGNPLGWDIAGDKKSLKKIERDDIVGYRKIHYYPENMLVSFSGGVTERQTIPLAEKYCSKPLANKDGARIEEFKTKQKKPQLKLRTKKVEQGHLILGFLTNGRGYSGRYPQGVLTAILGGGTSSRLWTEVREKRGLAYAVKASIDRYTDIGHFGVYAGVNTEKIDDAIKVILDQCYGITTKAYPISKKELAKAKGFLKGRFALALEASEAVGDYFAEQVLFDKEVLTPKEVFERLDRVTLDEVYKEAEKLFSPSGLNLAVIGPYNDQAKFEKLLQ